ncbi:hypothetical protein [Methylobacterium fujisawaense]|uniref:hypothetical protein n=1 Tax=Methylobacterium fujisawaense TaxID=107400 RepID=UPI00313B88A0
MRSLRANIVAAIEKHCSEGASGRLIGADEAADDILDAIPDPGENARLASFAREIISYIFDGTDADCLSIQALALHYGLLERTLYDPKVHGPSFAEPGAEWFEYTGTLKLARTTTEA